MKIDYNKLEIGDDFMTNITDFKNSISLMSIEELIRLRQQLKSQLACMVATPDLGQKISLVEEQITKHTQVKK